MRVRRGSVVISAVAALVSASLVMAASACGSPPKEMLHQPGAIEEPPEEAVEAGSSDSGIGQVVEANNAFGMDLYSKLAAADDGNLFFSPYSMSVALSMINEGAEGRTEDEMRSTLHLPADDILRPNMAAMHNRLNADGKPFELATGNALWTQQDYPLVPAYVNTIQRYYGGTATELDFIGDPEGSRTTINDYIAQQTKDRIQDLLPEGSIHDLTRLVLTNAIYFKGSWLQEFDPMDTKDEEFHVTPEISVTIPMMTLEPDEASRSATVDGTQVLELPYKGGALSMVILLPSEGAMPALEDALAAQGAEPYTSELHEARLDSVSIPKFELETDYKMKPVLGALGMQTAFSEEEADFTGMNEDGDLFLSEVFHKAFVKVDEEGTEAAAATGGTIEDQSARPTFRADRPFVFLIRDVKTDAILFMGRITDPSKK